MIRSPYVGAHWIALDDDRRIVVGKASTLEEGMVFGWVHTNIGPGMSRRDWRAFPEASVLSAISNEERVLCEGVHFDDDAIRSMTWYQDMLVDRAFDMIKADLEP